jgi:hypothetical protein
MAEPRTARIRTERPLTTRPLTDAEQMRRYRRGVTSRSNSGRPVWAEALPNGMPEFRPYVYRGLGCDAFTGEVVL